jgi:hypothetical protein
LKNRKKIQKLGEISSRFSRISNIRKNLKFQSEAKESQMKLRILKGSELQIILGEIQPKISQLKDVIEDIFIAYISKNYTKM